MLTVTVEQQFIVFLYLSTAGVMIGVVFDFVKAWGKIFHFSRKTFFAIDLFICLAATLIVYQVLFLTNWGEVRFYVFLALLLGLILYYVLFSRYLYNFFLKFFKTIKKFILKILKVNKALQDYLNKKRINCMESYKNFKKFLRKEKQHDR
jgi:spore cortex biosynthesis protein YabQ